MSHDAFAEYDSRIPEELRLPTVSENLDAMAAVESDPMIRTCMSLAAELLRLLRESPQRDDRACCACAASLHGAIFVAQASKQRLLRELVVGIQLRFGGLIDDDQSPHFETYDRIRESVLREIEGLANVSHWISVIMAENGFRSAGDAMPRGQVEINPDSSTVH